MKRTGFAQIPLMIALLLMAIAVPVATKLVQTNQDTRNKAAHGCAGAGEVAYSGNPCCAGLEQYDCKAAGSFSTCKCRVKPLNPSPTPATRFCTTRTWVNSVCTEKTYTRASDLTCDPSNCTKDSPTPKPSIPVTGTCNVNYQGNSKCVNNSVATCRCSGSVCNWESSNCGNNGCNTISSVEGKCNECSSSMTPTCKDQFYLQKCDNGKLKTVNCTSIFQQGVVGACVDGSCKSPGTQGSTCSAAEEGKHKCDGSFSMVCVKTAGESRAIYYMWTRSGDVCNNGCNASTGKCNLQPTSCDTVTMVGCEDTNSKKEWCKNGFTRVVDCPKNTPVCFGGVCKAVEPSIAPSCASVPGQSCVYVSNLSCSGISNTLIAGSGTCLGNLTCCKSTTSTDTCTKVSGQFCSYPSCQTAGADPGTGSCNGTATFCCKPKPTVPPITCQCVNHVYTGTGCGSNAGKACNVVATNTPTPGNPGSCVEACPNSSQKSLLQNCTPADSDGTSKDSICNKVGRVESCGGKNYCCPAIGAAWTSDMSKCPASKCTECPNTFSCYKNGDDYKWFATGMPMIDYTVVADSSCTGTKPKFLGKSKGDGNCDGSIDIWDYSLWLKEFSDGDKGTIVKSNWNSDFTGSEGVCDGVVDTLDFPLWQRYFNELKNNN